MEKKTLGEVLQRKFVKGPCEPSNFLYFCKLSHFRNPEPEFPNYNNPNFFFFFFFFFVLSVFRVHHSSRR